MHHDQSGRNMICFMELEDRSGSALFDAQAGSLAPFLAQEVLLSLGQMTMATEVRQELAQLMNSSGSHKDLAAKYATLVTKQTTAQLRLHAFADLALGSS